jgi:hypothetical protein
MVSRIELLISNLQETVKDLQRYMLAGLGAALFFVLLAFSGTKEVPFEAPTIGVSMPLDARVGLAIALSVYWVSSVISTLFVARAKRLVSEIRKVDEAIAEAALLFPSIVTLREYGPRLMMALLPAVFAVIGSIGLWGKQLLSYWPTVGQIMLSLPYIVLAVELRTSIGDDRVSNWSD